MPLHLSFQPKGATARGLLGLAPSISRTPRLDFKDAEAPLNSGATEEEDERQAARDTRNPVTD